MHNQEQSRLLQLPAELQLLVFEYAVIEDEPLLINCGCDSSYNNRADWRADQQRWATGEKHPPYQPGLTQTCSKLRALALPMFYEQNVFRGHYCYVSDVGMAIKWLRAIGSDNRRLLKDFCFWDHNPRFDWDIQNIRRGEVCREMAGRLEGANRGPCCHRVSFAENKEDEYLELVPVLFRMCSADVVQSDEGDTIGLHREGAVAK